MDRRIRRNWWDDQAVTGVVASAICLALVYGLERGVDAWIGRDSGIDYLYLLPLWVGVSLGGRRAGIVASILSAFVVSNLHGSEEALAGSQWAAFGINLAAFLLVGYIFESFGRQLARARSAASTDPLTGIANRRSGFSQARAMANRAREASGRLAVVTLDCDEFKLINDRHGHSSGDAALKAVASALTDSVRGTDKVFRLGGDEFVMVLADAGGLEAEVCLGRIRSQLERASIDAGFAIKISSGLAVAPRDGLAFDELLHVADARLYRNKRLIQGFAPSAGSTPATSS